MADSFSFSEIHKRPCKQNSDRYFVRPSVIKTHYILSYGGLILLFGGMTLFLTFFPTMNDTIRTSLPKEIRLALRSHKALFYQGGLLLTVTFCRGIIGLHLPDSLARINLRGTRWPVSHAH